MVYLVYEIKDLEGNFKLKIAVPSRNQTVRKVMKKAVYVQKFGNNHFVDIPSRNKKVLDVLKEAIILEK